MADDVVANRTNAHWSACVRRVAENRDRRAFLALFDYFSPRLNTYLQRQGVEETLAEDLAQEALLVVWTKAHLYREQRAAFSTWLFRIARNLWIDRLRAQRGIAYEPIESYAERAPDPRETFPPPDSADAERVRNLLLRLPANQAQVIYKSYFEGKSHGEIAAESGLPLGTVKSSLRLAIRAFKKALGEDVV